MKPGNETSEKKLTAVAIGVSALAIVAQILGVLFLGIDLGVNIDVALGAMGITGMGYTISRSALKGITTKQSTTD